MNFEKQISKGEGIPNEFRNMNSKIRGERPECTLAT